MLFAVGAFRGDGRVLSESINRTASAMVGCADGLFIASES